MTRRAKVTNWEHYLRHRAEQEKVDLWLTDAELFGWIEAGVEDDSDPEDVWSALLDTLSDSANKPT